MNKTCLNCGRGEDRPAIFRNEDHCSENCRKALENKASEESVSTGETLVYDEGGPERPLGRCPSEFSYFDVNDPEKCIHGSEEEHDIHSNASGSVRWREMGSGIKQRVRPIADRPQA